MKDIPLVNGSRLKLVLRMKGGPISSKRVVTISDYENWFDMSDVLSRSVAKDVIRWEKLCVGTFCFEFVIRDYSQFTTKSMVMIVFVCLFGSTQHFGLD